MSLFLVNCQGNFISFSQVFSFVFTYISLFFILFQSQKKIYIYIYLILVCFVVLPVASVICPALNENKCLLPQVSVSLNFINLHINNIHR